MLTVTNPLLHIDTGHNYPEVIAFRDRKAAGIGERLIVRSVEDSMQRGTVVLKHAGESRNKPNCGICTTPTATKAKTSAPSRSPPAKPGEEIVDLQVRFRTVGDITCTAPVISDADSLEKIIAETATITINERGAIRLDDQASEAAMEIVARAHSS
jgi:3'-phosphoadenosine 5'-phosphosulfate sulfotransferase (PAPS reductase)/FAD synthetase